VAHRIQWIVRLFRKPVSLPRPEAIRGAKKGSENGTAVAHAKGGGFFAPHDFDPARYQWSVGLERGSHFHVGSH